MTAAGDTEAFVVSIDEDAAVLCRPKERVPKKMPRVRARTAKCPRNAPEQPATAMGARAARHQGVTFIAVFLLRGSIAVPSLESEPRDMLGRNGRNGREGWNLVRDGFGTSLVV